MSGLYDLGLNKGLAWAHPLESHYAAMRRLIVANPAVGLANLKSGFEWVHPNDHLGRVLGFANPSSVRQCPLCAWHLFHPTLYQLAALDVCPLHGLRLTEVCPDCNLPWARPFSKLRPVCQTCGSVPWERLSRIRLKSQQYRELAWLDRWLADCHQAQDPEQYPTIHDTQRLTHRRSDREKPRFYQPDITTPHFISFEAHRHYGQFHSRLKRLNVRLDHFQLRRRKASLTQWAPSVHPSHFQTEGRARAMSIGPGLITPNTEMVTRITLAIRRILRWQQRFFACPHALQWRDQRSVRPEHVREGGAPCVLCMAFGLWCRAILLKHGGTLSAGGPDDQELCRFTFYDHYPNIPEGIYVKDKHGQRLRPSPEFERWFFLRTAEYAFAEFVRLATWIHQRTNHPEVRFKQTVYSLTKDQFSVPDAPSRIIDISQRDGEMIAHYWRTSPLDELVLPQEALETIHGCHRQTTCQLPEIWNLPPKPCDLTHADVLALFELELRKSAKRQFLYSRALQPRQTVSGCNPFDQRAVIGKQDISKHLGGTLIKVT
ncbi:hypothetical protein [Marinobacter salsuginis]|uniref:hypothetical protein n=1 Tax=Marinobacter salsuginis TaxID=418719 RepID=UPI00273FA4A1|nr:hypothetical protein [Marinobacter salsuginis]